MGCLSSKPADDNKKKMSKSISTFESNLASKVSKVAGTTDKKLTTFTSILMQLPKVGSSFVQVKPLYHKYDKDCSGGIDCQELKAAFKDLGASIEDSKVEKYFMEADMNADKDITYKEFLLCLAFAFYMDPFEPSKHSENFRKLNEGYQICAKAFAFFDEDGGGTISKEEVERALAENGSHKNIKNNGKSQDSSAIFKQLDADESGQVSFKEFLFCMVEWAGIDED
mmetsp:Transcript_12522/g.17101  ORF Transcript_12522/g.17101 Transcript_12522/m.17101 type:complete len:226 (-) Transcript_12522:241-918(-)|eukprot:CAMPEP_0196580018 /NCGR_PEP_ID=MMETSP1081-20130531/26363_1 /TAXON_ID=36882 /ORGANISM="Pyramimonas amylifera, Strain CCMP720" /LENGTH=225 /DNA_ID=CAMNT_0041899769 /DNA_START=343 /DNA_END=1020 /DNA_ORIENTATION=+